MARRDRFTLLDVSAQSHTNWQHDAKNHVTFSLLYLIYAAILVARLCGALSGFSFGVQFKVILCKVVYVIILSQQN